VRANNHCHAAARYHGVHAMPELIAFNRTKLDVESRTMSGRITEAELADWISEWQAITGRARGGPS
jgi:hypothetical protein